MHAEIAVSSLPCIGTLLQQINCVTTGVHSLMLVAKEVISNTCAVLSVYPSSMILVA